MVRNTPIVSNFGGGQSSHTINSAPTVVHSDRSFLTSTTALPTAETILGSDLGDEATTAHLLVRLMNFYIGPVARNLIQLVAQMENHAERLRHIESPLIIPLIVATEGSPVSKGIILVCKSFLAEFKFFPTNTDRAFESIGGKECYLGNLAAKWRNQPFRTNNM